ncbi:MAG: nitrilase-related carbon-nitrogen hydrolase [Armatimonadota bacterium]
MTAVFKISLRAVFVLMLIMSASMVNAADGKTKSHPSDIVIAAVQMQVRLADYKSEAAFRDRIDYYMSKAVHYAGDGPLIVAFPEDVGLGLVILGNYDKVKNCKSFKEAAGILANEYAAEIGNICRKYPGCSISRALLLARGENIRRVYNDTFSQAAKRHKVTIVAGSAPIAGVGSAVFNASFVYGPDGRLLGRQNKVHLTPLEDNSQGALDFTPGNLANVHAINTPAGRIGVAICYDAFFDDVIDRLDEQNAGILIQPSFNVGPWTPEQAADWKRGIWTAVKSHTGLVTGVNPMMVGNLWDIKVEGMSSIIGGSFEPPEDGYLAKAAHSNSEEIIVVKQPSQ